MVEEPEFRIIEFKYAQAGTGARFWIEWLVDVEYEAEEIQEEEYDSWINFFIKKIGMRPRMKKAKVKVIKTKKSWEIFSDPASTQVNTGYVNMTDACFAIDRYLINMKPTVHKYNTLRHSI